MYGKDIDDDFSQEEAYGRLVNNMSYRLLDGFTYEKKPRSFRTARGARPPPDTNLLDWEITSNTPVSKAMGKKSHLRKLYCFTYILFQTFFPPTQEIVCMRQQRRPNPDLPPRKSDVFKVPESPPPPKGSAGSNQLVDLESEMQLAKSTRKLTKNDLAILASLEQAKTLQKYLDLSLIHI